MKTKLIFQITLLLFAHFVTVSCQSDDAIPAPPILEEPPIVEPIDFSQIITDIELGVYDNTHSFIVYQNNELLVEEYFGGYGATDTHPQYSVTKSIASALIGIAVDQGFIASTDVSLLSFFPEYIDIQNPSVWKESITLKDVLTMRAGFEWDEWTYAYTDPRNDAYKLIRSSDMVKFLLDKPMAAQPGATFTYNSGCSMVLSAIIKKATGKTAAEFAEETIFSSLDIDESNWETGGGGLQNTAWGLHLKPKDMAKIGLLYLNGGIHETDVVISENWMNASLANYGNNYGYQWWLTDSDEYSARGWGGQFIFILPSKNLVMITTAENYSANTNPAGFRILDEVKLLLE